MKRKLNREINACGFENEVTIKEQTGSEKKKRKKAHEAVEVKKCDTKGNKGDSKAVKRKHEPKETKSVIVNDSELVVGENRVKKKKNKHKTTESLSESVHKENQQTQGVCDKLNSEGKISKKKKKVNENDTKEESQLVNDTAVFHGSEKKLKKKKNKILENDELISESQTIEEQQHADKLNVEDKKSKNKNKNKGQDDKNSSYITEDEQEREENIDVTDDEEEREQNIVNLLPHGKEKSTKKKKKDTKGATNVKTSESETKEEKKVQDLCKEYLKLWKKDREKWKFQKVRQVWLLNHMYDSALVKDKHFKILLKYLDGLKGKAREMTSADAQKIIDSDTSDSVKLTRARQIIQQLSTE